MNAGVYVIRSFVSQCYIGSIIKYNKYSKWDGTVYSDSVEPWYYQSQNQVYNLSTMHMRSIAKSPAHYITSIMANNVVYLSAYCISPFAFYMYVGLPLYSHMQCLSPHECINGYSDAAKPIERMTGRNSNAGDI